MKCGTGLLRSGFCKIPALSLQIIQKLRDTSSEGAIGLFISRLIGGRVLEEFDVRRSRDASYG